ncbi:MAG: sulfatase-like hydrolase/transferase [Leadbetterella sp.]
MKKVSLIYFFACICLHTSFAQNPDKKQDKPNIIVFMVDQLIPMYTGAYGDKLAKTPNIDKLAKNGVLFRNAYTTTPVCVPSRYSLLTGMYVKTHGAYDNGSMLRSDIPTHNDYLNRVGYETTISGKAHYIGPDQLHGFNRRLMTDIYPTEMKFMPKRNKESKAEDLHPMPIAIDYIGENAGPVQEDMMIDYDEKAVFNAIRYLSEKRTQPAASAQEAKPKPGKIPFFLQISLNKPHEPFLVNQKYWEMFEGVNIPIPKIPSNIEQMYTSMDRDLNKLHGVQRVKLRDTTSLKRVYRSYYSLVSYVDDKLGEVVKMLDQFGLKENTIIIFTSDHGDMLGHRGMVQKRVFYEHSSRIPMIISFPDQFMLGKKGLEVNDPVSIVDITPTVLDVCGIKDALPMDGRSLLPQMNEKFDKDRYIFCENYSEGVLTTCLMVRQGNHKLTYIYAGPNRDPELQLFDVSTDPLEMNNLATNPSHTTIKDKLLKIILSNFDPEKLDKDAQLSYERRRIINEGRKASEPPKWDYRPFEDVHKMYWR